MSIPRPGARRRSVADVMDSVFWEYHPRTEKNPRACTVVEFFEDFEDGSGTGDGRGDTTPTDGSTQKPEG